MGLGILVGPNQSRALTPPDKRIPPSITVKPRKLGMPATSEAIWKRRMFVILDAPWECAWQLEKQVSLLKSLNVFVLTRSRQKFAIAKCEAKKRVACNSRRRARLPKILQTRFQ